VICGGAGMAAREAALMLPQSSPPVVEANALSAGSRFSHGRWPGERPFVDFVGVDAAPTVAFARAPVTLRLASVSPSARAKATLPGPAAICEFERVPPSEIRASPSGATVLLCTVYQESRPIAAP